MRRRCHCLTTHTALFCARALPGGAPKNYRHVCNRAKINSEPAGAFLTSCIQTRLYSTTQPLAAHALIATSNVQSVTAICGPCCAARSTPPRKNPAVPPSPYTLLTTLSQGSSPSAVASTSHGMSHTSSRLSPGSRRSSPQPCFCRVLMTSPGVEKKAAGDA